MYGRRDVLMNNEERCQIQEVDKISSPDYIWLLINKLGWRRTHALKRFKETLDESIDSSKFPDLLKLKKGDLVEVRSEKEILATLKGSKYAGLSFMPEMLKYCGNRFKVLKKVERYIVEGKGMKKLKNTVILDGVTCDGSWHGGCDRNCYCLWREKWLMRIK